MTRTNIGIGGLILSILLFLLNQGWIDITNIIDPQPTPPIIVPEPEPDNPNEEILIQIEAEGFPELPSSLSAITQPIYDNLISNKDPNKALLLARVYRDWSLVVPTTWNQEQLKTFGQFQKDHYDSIKGILTHHNLTILSPGIGTLIDAVIKQAVGEHGDGDSLSPEDYEKLSEAFQAISARGYEAFQTLIKQ